MDAVEREEEEVNTLKQQFRFLPDKYKDCYLVYILTEKRQSTAIVFARSPDVCRLALMLQYLGIRAIPITGHMEESQRLLASCMFKAGQFNVLICTDMAIRDLDIPSVDIIISYDIPSNPQYYVHRIGRTACDGRSGVAISLVNQYELEWYTKIEKLIGKELPEFPAQEEEVLQFLEPVKEAKILAESKTSGSGDKKERMVKRILKSSLC